MEINHFGWFKTFKSFNRCAEPVLSTAEGFKPLPFFDVACEALSSPAPRGRMQEGARTI